MIAIRNGLPALVLAPMEGVTDAPMRELLSERGGFSFCVSEFFRISQDIPYPKAIAQHVPELTRGCKTLSGMPVQIQFLGGSPERLAESALRACQVGALGIDLNFGCPAPTVNRHDGGASLLKHPRRIRAIVEAVRKTVPAGIPVSAKLRLGWDSTHSIHENAEMAAQGGAAWLTIHARTKAQGYAPPVHWEPIGAVRRDLASLPIIANGDIWTLDDFKKCRDATGAEHFMIGRSALANPGLPLEIARELGMPVVPSETRLDWPALFARFAHFCRPFADNPNYTLCRLKQWLTFIKMRSQSPQLHFIDQLKRARNLTEFFAMLETEQRML